MSKLTGSFKYIDRVAKKHPNYTATAAIILGIAVLAIFAFNPAFPPFSFMASLSANPMGYMLPVALLVGGGALSLANLMAKNTKYAPLIGKITAVVVPILMFAAGYTFMMSGWGDFYPIIGLGLIAATPAVISKYSIPFFMDDTPEKRKKRGQGGPGSSISLKNRHRREKRVEMQPVKSKRSRRRADLFGSTASSTRRRDLSGNWRNDSEDDSADSDDANFRTRTVKPSRRAVPQPKQTSTRGRIVPDDGED